MATFRMSVPPNNAPAGSCPACQASLPSGIRGWIGRGTCPTCRKPLIRSPWRYSAVTAVTFAALVWRLSTHSATESLLLAAWFVSAGVGILLAAIDLHFQRLPTKILAAAGTVIGSLIVAAGLLDGHLMLVRNAAVAAVVLGLAYLTLALVSGRLGMGDVCLAALSGLLLGSDGWGLVVLGATLPLFLAGVIATVRLWARRVRPDSLIAHGPYLVAGTVLAAIIAGGG
jgi:leader peptidase (prepilin peptidase) / N-methyltransferase